jgi:hypothetical protein
MSNTECKLLHLAAENLTCFSIGADAEVHVGYLGELTSTVIRGHLRLKAMPYFPFLFSQAETLDQGFVTVTIL